MRIENNWLNIWTRWTSIKSNNKTAPIDQAILKMLESNALSPYISEELAQNICQDVEWDTNTNPLVSANNVDASSWTQSILTAAKKEIDRVQHLKQNAMNSFGQALQELMWIKTYSGRKNKTIQNKWYSSSHGLSWWLLGCRSDPDRDAVILSFLSSGFIDYDKFYTAYTLIKHPLSSRHKQRNPALNWSPSPIPEHWLMAIENSKIKNRLSIGMQGVKQKKSRKSI
jgi:hypothetical protein